MTFLNLLVSTVPTPTAQPNFDVRFGDYIGVDYYNDLIIPVWTDERAGGFDMECYSGIVSTPVSINNLLSEIPENFKLFQNYPNPFNPNTVIRYSVASQNGGLSLVSLKVYNSLGTEIATLVDRKQNTGNYEVNFSGEGLSSGIYFYKAAD
ncbi:MAG: T9SS type A sorting domain-containing protein [Ignavibacteria bacterium]